MSRLQSLLRACRKGLVVVAMISLTIPSLASGAESASQFLSESFDGVDPYDASSPTGDSGGSHQTGSILGGNDICADCCADLCQEGCCDGRTWTIRGWLDAGFMGNTASPTSKFNGPYNAIDRSNEAMFNQGYLIAERLIPTDGSWGTGGRVDLLYGEDFFLAQSAGFELRPSGAPHWNPQYYGLAIPQAYGEFGNDVVSIKAGHFYTPIGYEGVPAPNNFFYSKAYSYQFAGPFTHWGGLATVTLSSRWTAQVALTVVSWIAGARLGRATDSLFGSAERALIAVQQRVVHAHERVAAATEAAADIEKSLFGWIKEEAVERQVFQLDVKEKTERLASSLQQADLWLEVAETSLGLVREALASGTVASGTVASPPPQSELLDRLIEELASLRAQLTEATEIVDRIHERLTGPISESLAARIEEGIPITRRVAALLGSISTRIGMADERLSVAHSQVRKLGARAQRWILVAEIAITLFLLWMAIGQLAMCWIAWDRRGH